MRRRTMRLGVVLIGAATALFGAGAAHGDTYYVYSGDNFGYIGWSHKYAGVCDREADGASVYVNFQRTYPGTTVRMEESRGHGFCKQSTEGTYAVHRLQTCQNIPLAPDICSGWHEHR
ncbi:hypothetical protein ACFPM3_00350 [Streptomyces coeruleoprunus]|uniref:Secreted protein n=1 Tax=Streptomyces coeruleoprunus TaxID=285563 RepID=A0ABV9X659_9ACTN